jgi:hypothetical protein
MVANFYRPLSTKEQRLARWMLENGNPDAAQFFSQLADAEVTPWRCPCGCASINFKIKGKPPAPPGSYVIGDFLIVKGNEVSGIFIFESGGILGGIDVHGLSGDAPTGLPEPEELMTHEAYGRDVQSKR